MGRREGRAGAAPGAGGRRVVTVARDLWAEIQRREELWDAGLVDREATRDAHVAAGWTTCPHPDCPPWTCRER